MFQSTHPHGVRLKGVEYGDCSEEFQSTHPHGVRPDHPGHSPTFNVVSIHAPTWGATLIQRYRDPSGVFQSTHPHGVRHVSLDSPGSSLPVSIHAPTWGATLNAARCLNWKTVSIHAPTWGATAGGRRMTEEEKGFNPRTHMGCDIASLTLALIGCCFNPRTHMGCDCIFSNRLNITMQR